MAQSRKHWILQLASVTIAVCASTLALAVDLGFYVGGWNPGWYSAQQFDDVAMIIDATQGLYNDVRTFDDTQLGELQSWAQDNVADGEMDIIWLNGQTPSVLYPFGNAMPDGSLAELWVDNGNMFVNVGHPFAYSSYECDGRCPNESGYAGAGHVLDLNEGIQRGGGLEVLRRTPTGAEFMPSLADRPGTFRPVITAEVTGDWELAAVFASNTGDDTGALAEPCAIRNTVTGGSVVFVNMSADNIWINRGPVVS